MDGRTGLRLFLAHPLHLIFAFDTVRGGVHLAWRGPWDTAAEVMAVPEGRLYYRQDAPRLWAYVRGGDTLVPEVRYRSHVVQGRSVEFRYDLVAPEVDTVAVRQQLVHDDHYGDHALKGGFDFAGIDSGAVLLLRLGGEAGRWPLLWAAGPGRIEGFAGREIYVQETDGAGQLKVTFTGSLGP